MEIIDKYYSKGYRTLNKLHDKLNQKGFKISKSEVSKFIDSKHIKLHIFLIQINIKNIS